MKTIGKYFYVGILALLFISLSGAAQGKGLSELQAQLSQLESWLEQQEQAERMWREAVNSTDVVFIPAYMPVVGNLPAFMDNETFGTWVLAMAKSRDWSKETREEVLTQIAEFDEALREEIRNRYLPGLVDQIKKDREQISRIRAEMAGLKKDGPDISGLVGEWYASSNSKNIATIIASGNGYSYTGTDGNYKHTGTLRYDGTVFKGEVKDVPGFCCGNEGYIWLRVVDGNTLEVKSQWWKPGSKDRIILETGWDTLKRVNR